ncbi:hypothetical protein BHE74_00005263 [Ensete ventricosum]|nr:hypothetical protein BHE74_00005263 [Ensete ventricosum]
MDMGQPMLTPDKYWRLLNDPGLTYPVLYPSPQAVSAEAFLGLSHEVQALTGMIQAIIPHIPQLTQTMAPPQSEPHTQPKPIAASLLGIAQGREEPLAQFVSRYATEIRAVLDAHPSLVIQAFLRGLRPSKLF